MWPHFNSVGCESMADFGDVLRSIGEFGTFQKRMVFALCFPNIILPFQFACVFFIQSDPERHCNTDWILKADANMTRQEQLNLTVPLERDGSFSRCRMFVPVDWDVGTIRDHGLNQTTVCQNGWIYNSELYTATIVTDFDLVCDRAYLLQLAQTVMMTGILLGCLLFGPFAESFGRRRAVQIPMVANLIFTVTSALCPNVLLFMLSQFLMGIGYGGFRMNAIILATEWIGPSKRSWGACVTQLFGALGQALLAGVIYIIRDWRLAQFITAAPLAVICIYIWFLPESARWLLERGRTEEAKELLLKVAAVNKRTFKESLLEKIVVKEKTEKKSGVVILVQSSVLRKYFFTLLYAWFSVNVAYYCVSFNVGNLGLDVFMTQLLFGLTETVAQILCMWLLEALGRRLSIISTLLTGALLSALMLAFIPGYPVAVTALATSGRLLANWAASVCNVYVQELFPTSCRQTASGLGSFASRAGGLIAPLVNMLATYHWSIPMVIFSGLTLISGVLSFVLPETRGIELPDSTDDAENNRNKKMTKKECESNVHIKSSKL
ncbi:solute carrier family 22 member 13-like isoform X1 [Nerophis ophidion]|uniref:solute carrier family 22 member 13-like isoform X1 n=2 Tax=Nerophis ophidion TaxID=159077 RepID=UPI002AE03104|nr:solute carrier family 22 member 13-like isoform X1 [Nerophis ophidion]XP_061746316.1 solute carrier family 22 member 13-like isoform X1 [Nerophis ophidion]